MFGISITLFWGLFIYFSGIATVLISIWYWLNIQENDHQNILRRQSLHETKLPNSLADLVQNKECYKRRETCLALNLILQFFFQERRYDLNISKWLTKLLSQEFTELLKHKTLSKIINKMEIQDLCLGNNFPVLKSVTPLNVQFVKNSTLLKNVEVNVEIEYTGGFQLAIDAMSKLTRKAMVKIKVVRLSGKGCLELSRYPFTHWSFSFYEEPESEFEVESTVLGHQIPRFKTIIINQLRTLLKRKHTLPYYKLRAAPLVKRPPKYSPPTPLPDEDASDGPLSGSLYVTLLKCSRLQPCLVGPTMHFSVTLSEVPLVCAYETSVGIWIVLDIVLKKLPSTAVGILLRNADDKSQIIETVSSKSAAFIAGLRKNDIILAVNNIPLMSGSQVAKLFSSSSLKKGQTSQDISMRVKRLIYTDHKRVRKDYVQASVESKLFDSGCFDEGVSNRFTSTQSTPVSLDDISLDSGCAVGDSVDRISKSNSTADRSISGQSNARNSGEPSASRCSTPESSRSSSPETRSRSGTLPTIQSVDEKLTENTFEKSLDSSAPIPIPLNNRCEESSMFQERQTMSTYSSKAGTPTSAFEFAQSVTPGTPLLKMDLKSQSKRSPNKGRTVIKHFETSPVEGSCDSVLGNDFTFHLDEESRYINVCIWSQQSSQEGEKQAASGEKFGSAKEAFNKLRKRDGKDQADKDTEKKTWVKETSTRVSSMETPNPMTGHPDHVLVGYSNTNIADLIPATRLNTQGCVTRVVPFEPADPGCPEIADHPLMAHKGFEPSLCYGDVSMSIMHLSLEKFGSLSKNFEKSAGTPAAPSEDESANDATLSEEEDFAVLQEDTKEERDHVFKRTHFSSATQCNFCKKKIWLKDAYQCSECGIICHKKCMLRCEQATVCDFGGLRYREIRDPCVKEDSKPMPEIIMTSVPNTQDSKEDKKSPPHSPQSPRHTLGSLLSHISAQSGPLKRAGSAQNLAPPVHGTEPGFSHSLPPSPQHTPRPSRKNSLTGNPFAADEITEGDHLEGVMEKLVSFPYDEQLVCLARETSHKLYSHLPRKERIDRITKELDVLQSRVDREGETRVELAQQEKEAAEQKKDSVQRTKLALLISECDARTQALALLTMHYFTALQAAQEEEQQETENAPQH